MTPIPVCAVFRQAPIGQGDRELKALGENHHPSGEELAV